MVGEGGFEPPKSLTTDLQAVLKIRCKPSKLQCLALCTKPQTIIVDNTQTLKVTTLAYQELI